MGYLAEVYFVEDDLVWVADTPKPREERQGCDNDEDELVVALGTGARGLGGGGFHELVKLGV